MPPFPRPPSATERALERIEAELGFQAQDQKRIAEALCAMISSHMFNSTSARAQDVDIVVELARCKARLSVIRER